MKDRRAIALLIGAVAVSWLLLEMALSVANRVLDLGIRQPSYALAAVGAGFWFDINRDFGVWHRPNSGFRHVKSCFDVTYRANSVGARDPERPQQSKDRRIAVLGDSFIEGWGIADGRRLTDLLEKDTGLAHLNFGAAGNFGTIQSMLLYRTLAKSFDHDAVVFGILPNNDFLDNDREHGRVTQADRYRPYLIGEYPDYRLVYDSPEALGGGADRLSRRLGAAIAEFSIVFNAVMRLGEVERERRATARLRAQDYSGYYDFSPADFALMRFTIEEIAREAAPRPVLIFTIPTLPDLKRLGAGEPAKLPEKLAALAADLKVEYLDLLPAFAAEGTAAARHYLPCDGHWSESGNRAAFERLKTTNFYRRLAPR